MGNCNTCINYDANHTYPGTGWCKIEKDYVKETDSCDQHEEG